MTTRAYGVRSARSPRSHYYVILIVTLFATELATPTITDVRIRTPYHVLLNFIKLLYTSSFGGPFVKQFALCYRTVVCLSVLSVCNVVIL